LKQLRTAVIKLSRLLKEMVEFTIDLVDDLLLIVVVRIVIRGDFSLGEAFGEAKLIEFE
jgi:hypothetical protein